MNIYDLFFGLIKPICNCGNDPKVCQSQWHKGRLLFGVDKDGNPDYSKAPKLDHIEALKTFVENYENT